MHLVNRSNLILPKQWRMMSIFVKGCKEIIVVRMSLSSSQILRLALVGIQRFLDYLSQLCYHSVQTKKIRGKDAVVLQWSVDGPFLGHWDCDAWPVQCDTRSDLRLTMFRVAQWQCALLHGTVLYRLCCGIGALAGIAIGMFICGAVLSSIITIVIYSRWYVGYSVLSCVNINISL